jgi:putative N6-adenine-specific DNA methylase
MSEQDPERKTLTLKTRAVKPRPAAGGDQTRARIGARARQVAQLKIAKEKLSRLHAAGTEHSAAEPSQEGKPLIVRKAPGASYGDKPRRGQRADSRAPRGDRTGDDSRQSATSQRGERATGGDRADEPARANRGSAPREPTPRPASAPKALPLRDGAQTERASALVLDTEIFHIFAPCPTGLEEALAAELSALGYAQVQATRAGCHFVADWWGVQRANLYSRLATRILVRLGQAPVQREDDILELAQSIGWERWFGAEHTLRVDTSAVKSPMQSLQYCNLRAKDGICDRLRDLEGARPSIDTVRPDARVHLFLSHDTGTMYLDTSGESLFKRGWRLDKGDAPLRENLAAGLLALSGWDPEAALLDPFCGSGTILIEAAWIALGVPPGITRPFGFERLRDHDPHRWEDLKDEARSRILPELASPLIGIDANPDAIEAARRNAERAYLTEDTIQFELGDARDAVAPAPNGWIVTNPPYGERLEEEDVEFWREWSTCLKKEFAGWQVNVITSDHDLPKHLRLKAERRTPIFNGALDCRLFSFELVANSYRDKPPAQET